LGCVALARLARRKCQMPMHTAMCESAIRVCAGA
jgi:hypothetical protein